MTGDGGGWTTEVRSGPASELFEISWLDGLSVGRRLVHVRPSNAALVLGSSQVPGAVDARLAADRGVDIVTRRSGGGAVWLDDGLEWFDVVVPPDDPLAIDDVQRAFLWLGELWADVVRGFVHHGSVVETHRGRLERSPLNTLICFAGLGPGEVTIDGRKVVGLSQRRTRRYTLFQCGLLRAWDPNPLVELLLPGLRSAGIVSDRRPVGALVDDLAGRCVGLDDPSVPAAFAQRLAKR
jgi:lipoate-protein ligase A